MAEECRYDEAAFPAPLVEHRGLRCCALFRHRKIIRPRKLRSRPWSLIVVGSVCQDILNSTENFREKTGQEMLGVGRGGTGGERIPRDLRWI